MAQVVEDGGSAETSPSHFKRLKEDEDEEMRMKTVVSTRRSHPIQAAVGATTLLLLLMLLLRQVEGEQRRLVICVIPSVMMLFMSLVAYSLVVPTDVMSAFQHLAAGLLVSAVSVELVPTMMEAPNDASNLVGMIGGFAAGIGALTALSTFCGSEVDEDADEEALARTPRGLTAIGHAQRAAVQAAPPFPFALVFAVTTDAAVDGILLGLASSATVGEGGANAVRAACSHPTCNSAHHGRGYLLQPTRAAHT